jgi:hypothetical protein
MRNLLAALFLAAALPAGAAEPPAQDALPPGFESVPPAAEKLRRELERAADAVRESMGRALLSLEGVARALPRYEAPEFNDNGDIIIRRRPPQSKEQNDRDGTI